MTTKYLFVPTLLLLFTGCGSASNDGPIAQATSVTQELSAEEQMAFHSSLSSERKMLQEVLQAKTTGESQKLTANITSEPFLVELAAERSKLQQALNQQQTMRGKPQPGMLSEVEQHHQEALQRQMELLQAAERVQPE